MSRKRRRGTLFMLAFILAAFAYILTGLLRNAPVAHADTVLMEGGAAVAEFPGSQNGIYMPAIFNGSLCKGNNVCKVEPFSGEAGALTPSAPGPLDQSVAAAADQLVQDVKNTKGPVIAVGISAGSPVVKEAARRLQNDPAGPAAGDLKVITAGDIDNGIGKLVPPGTHLDSLGYTVPEQTPLKYSLTQVTNESDGMAVVPPDPLNYPFAALNTAVGSVYAHVSYFKAHLDDPNNVVTHDGNVTNITLRNEGDPPLVQALNAMGQPDLANAIRGPLEDQINAVRQFAGDQAPLNTPPQLVDQAISSVAPIVAASIDQQKEQLASELTPIFANDPQMLQYIPPALLQDMQAAGPQNTAVQADAITPASPDPAASDPAPPQDNPPATPIMQAAGFVPPAPDPGPPADGPAPQADNPPTGDFQFTGTVVPDAPAPAPPSEDAPQVDKAPPADVVPPVDQSTHDQGFQPADNPGPGIDQPSDGGSHQVQLVSNTAPAPADDGGSSNAGPLTGPSADNPPADGGFQQAA